MDYREHRQEAADFLRDIDEGRAAGRTLLLCEIHWGAATHSIRAYARWRGWRVSRSPRLRELVDRIIDDCGDSSLEERFAKARVLHSNFYNGFLTAEQVAENAPEAHSFSERVLALLPPTMRRRRPPSHRRHPHPAARLAPLAASFNCHHSS